MKNAIILAAMLMGAMDSLAYAQEPLAGKWQIKQATPFTTAAQRTTDAIAPGTLMLELQVSPTKQITGKIVQARNNQIDTIESGRLTGKQFTFTAKESHRVWTGEIQDQNTIVVHRIDADPQQTATFPTASGPDGTIPAAITKPGGQSGKVRPPIIATVPPSTDNNTKGTAANTTKATIDPQSKPEPIVFYRIE